MEHVDDPHDDSFAEAPPDPEFTNERAWIDAGTMRRGQPLMFSTPATPDPDAPSAESRFLVDWVDGHRTSTYAADPSYPAGVAIDVALDAPKACRLELAYPAARCGMWVITCRRCGFAISLSTAGRADDPKSVRVPCKAD